MCEANMSNEILQLVNSQKDNFVKVCSDDSIEFDREASFALQIINGNDYLTSTALRNKASLQAAITNVAAIGISLNPASKQAYLVPRDGKVCLDISYMGIMHLAQQTGAIKWGQAVIVRANDQFTLNGIDEPPEHKFNPFDDMTKRGEIIGVYVVVKTDTNDYLTHAMPISKVYEIRDRSVAWKSHLAKGTSCPWVTDNEEMAKKTCVKQAAKYWPRRDRLDAAVHYVNVEGEEGLASIAEEKEVQGEKLIHGKYKVGSGISGTGGYMEALSVDMQNLLREIAEDVKSVMGNPLESYGLLGELSELNNLEDDHKIALWSLFDSKERSALKRAGEELKLPI
jgi:recombination protein RecT